MIKVLIIFLMLVSVVQAQTTLEGVPADTLLSESQKLVQKENLKLLILKDKTPEKNDYINHYNRGTVEANLEKSIDMFGRERYDDGNLSYHKVTYPNGTELDNINFTQVKPDTQAIFGKNLVFTHCNLVNVKIDPTWTVTKSNTSQLRKSKVSEVLRGDGYYDVEVKTEWKNDKTDIWEDLTIETEEMSADALTDFNLRLTEQNK